MEFVEAIFESGIMLSIIVIPAFIAYMIEWFRGTKRDFEVLVFHIGLDVYNNQLTDSERKRIGERTHQLIMDLGKWELEENAKYAEYKEKYAAYLDK